MAILERHQHHDYKDGLVYVDLGNNGINGIEHPDAFALMKDGYVKSSKSLWALGNYSRFIRPGFHRVDSQGSTPEIMVSAYENPVNSEVIIVLVNTSEENVELRLNNLKMTKKYVTNDMHELSFEKLPNLICPKKSVVTFVTELRK